MLLLLCMNEKRLKNLLPEGGAETVRMRREGMKTIYAHSLCRRMSSFKVSFAA